jgi:diacylglycerol kinase family enzyme
MKKIEIQSRDPLLVDLDGEVFFDTSLQVEIIPQAVKIVTPGGIGFLKRADLHE